jgi:hypothetical protein
MMAHVQPGRAAIEQDWTEIVASEQDVRPSGWSPDGRLLYFVSSRDGTRCLYASRIDPATGRPWDRRSWFGIFTDRAIFFPAHSALLSTGPGNAVRGGFFFYDLAALSVEYLDHAPLSIG